MFCYLLKMESHLDSFSVEEALEEESDVIATFVDFRDVDSVGEEVVRRKLKDASEHEVFREENTAHNMKKMSNMFNNYTGLHQDTHLQSRSTMRRTFVSLPLSASAFSSSGCCCCDSCRSWSFFISTILSRYKLSLSTKPNKINDYSFKRKVLFKLLSVTFRFLLPEDVSRRMHKFHLSDFDRTARLWRDLKVGRVAVERDVIRHDIRSKQNGYEYCKTCLWRESPFGIFVLSPKHWRNMRL